MLTCYFGVPGCGKTTLLTKFAVRELRRIRKGKSKYLHVYTNFYCKGAERIDFKDLASFKVVDSLILIDEITLDADNRNFKAFNNDTRDFFILHRHLCNDIIYATQSYDMVDLKIRRLTQELWYMSRSVVPFLSAFTSAKRIYRTISINEHTSELVMGYRFCNFIEALCTPNRKFVLRNRYYKYFDSFDEGALADRPEFLSELWEEAILDDFISEKLKTTVLEPLKVFLKDKKEEHYEIKELREKAQNEANNEDLGRFYDLDIDDE